jgi:4-hydroxy-tetrahydrodipicolinate reductase
MRILLVGRGKMGKLIEATALAAGDTVIACLGRDNLSLLDALGPVADVVMDFSNPETPTAVAAYVQRSGTPLVSGTTGYTEAQKAALFSLGASVPLLWSANYSVGVAVFCRILSQIGDTLLPDFDVELTETHHNQKVDAPSGTAKLLVEALDPRHELTPVYGREGCCGKRPEKEIGVHSLRGGTVAGEHTVSFFGTDEVLEISHKAASRQIFVNGALHMARLMVGKPAGVYDLQKILFGE